METECAFTVLLPPDFTARQVIISLDGAYAHYAAACGMAVDALTDEDKYNALADALITTCAQWIDNGEAQ